MPTRIAPLFAAISVPRPCRCFAKDRDSETPGLGARGSWIGARREFLLKARDVLKQPAAGQLEKAEPELWVLEIKLLKPIVGQRLHVAGLAADERLRAPAVRGEKAKFADHRPGRYVHAGFAQDKMARVDEIHRLRHIAFPEQDFAGLDVPARHERAQPGHVDFAAARTVGLADQISHLL